MMKGEFLKKAVAAALVMTMVSGSMPVGNYVVNAEPSDGTSNSQNIAQYTVRWVNYDGSLLKSDVVSSGQTPSYDGDIPQREENSFYTYIFTGWDKAVSAVTEDTVYTALFKAVPKKALELTVCDGTDRTNNLPYFSEWNKTTTGSEQIYPASMLSGMAGKEINSITFYPDDETTVNVKGMQVYLLETDYDTLSGWVDVESEAVKVFDGDYTFNGENSLIEFNTPFVYNGGNLLVMVKNTANGTESTGKRFQAESQSQNTSAYRYLNP